MKCKDCQNEISIKAEATKVGDVIDCDNCGAEYEVTKLDPLQLEIIEEEK